MIDTLRRSQEAPELVTKALTYLQGVKGNLAQHKRKVAAKKQQEMQRGMMLMYPGQVLSGPPSQPSSGVPEVPSSVQMPPVHSEPGRMDLS